MLKLEAQNLGDRVLTPELFQQSQVLKIGQVVFKGSQEQIKHSGGVQTEVADKSLDVLAHQGHILRVYIELRYFDDQLCEAFILLPQQVELDLGVVFLGVGLTRHFFETIFIQFGLATCDQDVVLKEHMAVLNGDHLLLDELGKDWFQSVAEGIVL